MNPLNIVLALALIGFAIALAVLTQGTLLPVTLPFTVYGLKLLGVKIE